MKVAQSPDFLQSVIDAQWAWIAQDGEMPVPLADVFDAVLCLEWDDGGFIFLTKGEGTVEVHTLFLPKAKNPKACAEQAAAFIFGHGFDRIVTHVPADNRHADRLTRRMGFTRTHTEPVAFLRNGIKHDVHHYALVKDDWQGARECPQQEL